ncbi:hypothetical protein CTA1_1337 [Colletotrichum tanaceti]|uniref:Uncharacterized protein n=1 Tax=Colletotrichum tanaceti TaxID=1306861 RepID=A0A4U6X3C4_9PEZI|nr:hypothetical protein CTA1_1337 [Colletotrichum tanaceti]
MKGVGHKLDKTNGPTFIQELTGYHWASETRMEVAATQKPRGLLCGGSEGVGNGGAVALTVKRVNLGRLENDVSEEDADPLAGAGGFWQPDVDFLTMSEPIKPHPRLKDLQFSLEPTFKCINGALQRL